MEDDNTQQHRVDQDDIVVKSAKKSNLLKILFFVILGLLVVFAAIVFFIGSATKAPLAVSNKFIDYIQASNSSAAYDLFSTETKKVVPNDEFDGVVQQIGSILNTNEKVITKEINGETGSAATSKITYEIEGTDENTYQVIVNLTKDNGVWKILNFDSKLK